jgi:hypothetical protein
MPYTGVLSARSGKPALPPTVSVEGSGEMCPIRPIVLWALDFQFDQTADGRPGFYGEVQFRGTRQAVPGGCDVLRDKGREYARRLREAAVAA